MLWRPAPSALTPLTATALSSAATIHTTTGPAAKIGPIPGIMRKAEPNNRPQSLPRTRPSCPNASCVRRCRSSLPLAHPYGTSQRWTICACRLRRVGAPSLLDYLLHACDKLRQLNVLWTFWNLLWCSLRFQTIVASLRLPISKGARSTTHLNLGCVERCGISSVVRVANNSPGECARLGRALRYGFLDGGIPVADRLGVDRKRARSRSPYRRGTFAVGQRRRC